MYYIKHKFTNNVYHALFEIGTFLEQMNNKINYIYIEHIDKESIPYQLFKLIKSIELLETKPEEYTLLDFIDYSTNPTKLYILLRNTFSYLLEETIDRTKKYYISRKYNSNVENHKNISTRHIINEDDFYNKSLKYLGFSFIVMEELSILEQIQLFTNASYIISPHGAALTLSLFTNKDTQIIEILPIVNDKYHFKNICQFLDIPYKLYSNVKVLDNYLNMEINIDEFKFFIL